MWRKSVISFEQPLKFEQRLVVKCDGIELVEPQTCLPETIAHRIGRERRVVLFPGKTLLLRSGNQLPVAQNGCCCVVVKSGYAEDIQSEKVCRLLVIRNMLENKGFKKRCGQFIAAVVPVIAVVGAHTFARRFEAMDKSIEPVGEWYIVLRT